MDHSLIISNLAQNSNTFRELFSGVTPEEIRWKINPEKWNLVEIVAHLYDEEREDFRARLRHVLEQPGVPLPPIDPAGWVKERNYSSRDFSETLKAFLAERELSIQWLRSLSKPNWKSAYMHPTHGALHAEMFLANWVAHDFLHFRQITATRFQYLAHSTGESLKYAGDW